MSVSNILVTVPLDIQRKAGELLVFRAYLLINNSNNNKEAYQVNLYQEIVED